MFKKILLASCLCVLGLWLAGYDMATIKRSFSGAADTSAQTVTGGLNDDGWGN